MSVEWNQHEKYVQVKTKYENTKIKNFKAKRILQADQDREKGSTEVKKKVVVSDGIQIFCFNFF